MKVNGWTLIAHPLFTEQVAVLAAAVEAEKAKDPEGYRSSPNAKLLAAIFEIILKRIPSDPSNKRYRMGGTLGDDYKDWFRDKFGGGRFRLFFRYDSRAKVIAYAWFNDEKSLRTYGAKNDAYAVFQKMLNGGNPPSAWNDLKAHCSQLQALDAIAEALAVLEEEQSGKGPSAI
jgi:toxin YhaV